MKVHYQIRWRPEQDAVYWIHLSTAQDAGLEFWQTGFNATITYQSVPKECVNERIVRQTTYPSKRTKSNTQNIMGSCEIQQFALASGNREQVADVEV